MNNFNDDIKNKSKYSKKQNNIINPKLLKLLQKEETGFKNISLWKHRNKKWVCNFIENGKEQIYRFEKFLDAYTYMYQKFYYKNKFMYSVLKNEDTELRYAGIAFDDIVNGDGIGAVFFTQYCPHHCTKCQNPQTWSKDGGMKFTQNIFDNLMKYYNTVPFANRLTLSGGDPLSNLNITNFISAEFKRQYPNKQLWIYTGYKFEELNDTKYYPILELSDVIVDGMFKFEKRDITLRYRGSSNQRIFVKQENGEWIDATT